MPVANEKPSVVVSKIKFVDKSQFPDFKEAMVRIDKETGDHVYYHKTGIFQVDKDGNRKILQLHPSREKSPIKKANPEQNNAAETESPYAHLRKRHEVVDSGPMIPELEVVPGESPDTTSDYPVGSLTLMGGGIGKGPNFTFYNVRSYKGKVFAKKI